MPRRIRSPTAPASARPSPSSARRGATMAIGRLRDGGGGDDDIGEEGNDSLFAEINITPLTDVFLVMVVIFMVSALAEVEQNRKEQKQQQAQQEQTEVQKKSGLRINLPQGKAQEIDTSKASL